jgi:transcriptional regulator with XRE-family HTH domain
MAAETRIGTKIKRARERKRMSQQELADKLGVSRSAVNAWERDRSYPRSSIGALEDILSITIDDEPAAAPGLVPTDEWEAAVLSDHDLPGDVKRAIVLDSRAARAAYSPQARPAAPRRTAAG